jgi:hypothetical protein
MSRKWLAVPVLLVLTFCFIQFASSFVILTSSSDFLQGYFYNTTLENNNLTLDFSNSTEWEQAVDSNMIIYFRMNNDTLAGDRATNVFDYTSAGNNGTMTSVEWYRLGKFGKCLRFDSASDSVTTKPSASFDSAQNLSVEFWMKFEVISSVNYILGIWHNTSDRIDLSYVNGPGFVIANNISMNNSLFYTGSTASENAWYHVALVIEGNSNAEFDNSSAVWSFYLNGQLAEQVNQYQSIANLTNGWNVTIGSGGGFYLNGYLDQFIFYRKALTSQEINQDYANGRKHFASGEYLSKIFMQPIPSSWDNISWVSETPPGTGVEVRTRTSDNSVHWIPWSAPAGNPSGLINSSAMFLQFKANLTTDNPDIVPKLLSVAINYTLPDTTPPAIISYSIKPRVFYANGYTNISIVASDSAGVNAVLANITLPGGGYEIVSLNNNGTYNYSALGKGLGTYNMNISINDSAGNSAYLLTQFLAASPTTFSVNVTNWTGQLSSTIKVYYPGTTEEIASYLSVVGVFLSQPIPEYSYDLLFTVLSGRLQVTLQNVNINANLNRKIVLDKFNGSIVYFINSTYAAENGKARLSYEGTTMNKTRLRVFSCEQWDFSAGCAGIMNATTSTQNTTDNYFEVTGIGPLISRGVALVIDESWCGDRTCTAEYEDTSSCSQDCTCTSGATRLCSARYKGVCALGNETCVSGQWTGCTVAKTTETCNSKDDDCDGITDNIDNKTSADATHCRCYNGGSPVQEVCNGIDDNCNGQIDEGGDCCQNDQTRQCGSDVGICRYGTSTCVNNIWGNCTDGVKPEPIEICFDSADNNCNGEVDEECDHCTNKMKDFDEEGLDCGGAKCDACPSFPWWILAIVGVIILGLLVYLIKMFGKEGKELTWEELKKKYTPAESP